MYRPKDRKTIPLFPELIPLGGGLAAGNRWRRLAGLIPWERLESDIAYPTDAGLLNKCRQWTVKAIRTVEKRFNLKEKARTYRRKAQAAYLGFQKKRRKTKREIRLMRGKLLRYCGAMSDSWRRCLPDTPESSRRTSGNF